MMKDKDYEFDPLTHAVIGAAIEVHRVIDPGFLESVYEEALAVELEERSILFERQYPIAVTYKGHNIGEGRLDLFVDGRLVVELKAVEALLPIHMAQALSYMKMTQCKTGLLINFNVPILTKGIRRLVLPS
jgi:GxxExxY protein